PPASGHCRGRRAALGVAVALAAVGAAALLAAGRMLVVADPLPPRADAIVILGGSIPDRTLAAADLYRAGLAPRVVVTREVARTGQAALDARGVRLPEDDELTVMALRGLGVPSRAIVVLRRRGISPGGGRRRPPASPPSRPPQQRPGPPARIHLANDVAPADELPAHVHLRDRRPVGEALDRLALLRLGEHVDRLEGHADLSQHLHRGGREAAHREARRPLHVDEDLVALHLPRHLVPPVGHPRSLSYAAAVRSARA